MDRISKFLYNDCDGAVVCLEKNGSVLVDIQNRPIILSIGMIHGSQEEMMDQVSYVMSKASACNESDGICTVIEGNHKSFRFPELRMKNIFDFLRFRYEKQCTNGIIHFINISFIHRIGIKFAMNVIPSILSKQIVIHNSLKNFQKYIPESSFLERWGGNVEFDIDNFVITECEKEGVSRSLERKNIHSSQLQESLNVLSSIKDCIQLKVMKQTCKGEWNKKTMVLSKNEIFVYDTHYVRFTNNYKYKFDIDNVVLEFENENRFVINDNIRRFIFMTNNTKDYDILKQHKFRNKV